MSMRIQSQAQAAYVATQQALAPLTGKKAEAVKTADEPQKAAGGLNAPAYTVEISDAAREKYAAAQRGAAAEEPQDGSTNAAQQTLTAANGGECRRDDTDGCKYGKRCAAADRSGGCGGVVCARR